MITGSIKYFLTSLLAGICLATFDISFTKTDNDLIFKELTTPNGIWRYETLGEATKGILFIHGASSSNNIWKYQKDLNIKGFKSIYINLLGYGNSDKPEEGYSLENWIMGLHRIIEQEQLEQVVFVAHSNGVILAKEYYRRYPESVSKMLLLDGMLKQVMAPEMMNWLRTSLERSDYEEFMKNNIAQMPVQGLTATDAELLRKDGLNTPRTVTLAEFNLVSDPNTWNPLEIKCPVTIVHSRNPLWTEEYKQWLSQSIPRLTLKEWNDAGHFLQLQFPERLNQLITSFVN